ncbi:MAG: hypothetical protein ABI402_05290 [Ferruginibacter sp.]
MLISCTRVFNRFYILALIFTVFNSADIFAQSETKSHVSSDKMFIISYPASWKINKAEEENSEFCVNTPGGNMFNPSTVKMLIQNKAAGYEKANIHDMSEVEIKMMKAQPEIYMNLEVLESNFKTIKDHEWWILYGKMTNKKQVYFTKSYKTIHNNKVYMLTYFSSEKNFEKYKDDAQKIFESIDFLTKNESFKSPK